MAVLGHFVQKSCLSIFYAEKTYCSFQINFHTRMNCLPTQKMITDLTSAIRDQLQVHYYGNLSIIL